MIIVGLTGGIGHGKTTFAEYLSKYAKKHRHWETWELVAEVATALRNEKPKHPSPGNMAAINTWLTDLADIVATVVHVPADFTQLALTPERVKQNPENYAKLYEYLEEMQLNPDLQTAEITADNKAVFRPLLQWLGGYLVLKVDDGIWYDEIVRRLHQYDQAGLDLVTVGGVRFPSDAERLRNAGGVIMEIKRPAMADQDKHDLTERKRNLIKPDSLIVNDGSLHQLEKCAALVLGDASARRLKSSYHASDFSVA